jgi:hypothetical protein
VYFNSSPSVPGTTLAGKLSGCWNVSLQYCLHAVSYSALNAEDYKFWTFWCKLSSSAWTGLLRIMALYDDTFSNLYIHTSYFLTFQPFSLSSLAVHPFHSFSVRFGPFRCFQRPLATHEWRTNTTPNCPTVCQSQFNDGYSYRCFMVGLLYILLLKVYGMLSVGMIMISRSLRSVRDVYRQFTAVTDYFY